MGAVTAMEKFAFEKPLKYRQRRCIRVDDDKLFHRRGPATQHVLSPTVVRRALGVSSLAEAENRSLLRDSKAATGCSWSASYGGAVPWRTVYEDVGMRDGVFYSIRISESCCM